MSEESTSGGLRPEDDVRTDVGVVAMLLQTGEERRIAVDQMMWQVPALSLTAQSFLLSIALGAAALPLTRLLSASLAFVAALAAIQLILKHRFRELEQAHWLERLASEHGLPNMHAPEETAKFAWRGRYHPWLREASLRGSAWHRTLGLFRRWLVSRSSLAIWTGALTCFALVDAGIVAFAVINLFAQ